MSSKNSNNIDVWYSTIPKSTLSSFKPSLTILITQKNIIDNNVNLVAKELNFNIELKNNEENIQSIIDSCDGILILKSKSKSEISTLNFIINYATYGGILNKKHSKKEKKPKPYLEISSSLHSCYGDGLEQTKYPSLDWIDDCFKIYYFLTTYKISRLYITGNDDDDPFWSMRVYKFLMTSLYRFKS